MPKKKRKFSFSLSFGKKKKKQSPTATRTATSVVQILFMSFVAIIVLILGWIAFYLYQMIYGTIGQVESIMTFDENAVTEVINFTVYDEVEVIWAEKQQYQIPPSVHNPFFIQAPPAPEPVEGEGEEEEGGE